MYQLKSLQDTIAAVATPAGQGGIGVVRLSGPESLSIAGGMFVSKSKRTPSEFKSHTVHYGCIVNRQDEDEDATGSDHQIIDEVLLTVMRAPRTYTKEDVVEISCHGGLVPLKGILNLALALGARLAEPGEFTKRAFLNGRLDLTQAEAVLDIIQSRTDAFLKVSTHQLKGELSAELEIIREHLMNVYVEIEALVNFPDDGIPSNGKLKNKIDAAEERVEQLLASSEQGRILKEGIKLVICGKANVGKSSLLNVLLKEPRAIVSEMKGTTRDTIEETAQIRGIPFGLVDTAGIIDPKDEIEKEALKRSHMHIQRADLALLVMDAAQKMTNEDQEIIAKVQSQNTLVVLNKCDLGIKIETNRIARILENKKIVRVSALKKTGIAELEDAVMENILHAGAVDTHGTLVSNVRHIDALKKCVSVITKGGELLQAEQPLELVSEEIKQAVNALDSITGRNIDADLLDKIFSEFCIGK